MLKVIVHANIFCAATTRGGMEIVMKYCGNCGTALADEANACSNCGTFTKSYTQCEQATNTPTATAPKAESGIVVAVKVLLILAAVAQGWLLIPLAWCIPMTISYFNSIKYNRPVSMALKICTLLFVSQIAGILMLCDQEH